MTDQMNDTNGSPEESYTDLIELLFFAYRDFVSEPDALLQAYDFGRAHHRVLHFVNRYPGRTVADLLDTLKITKQSLGRVLKQLVDEGYVEQRPGETDRRQRNLHATEKGAELANALLARQQERFQRALRNHDQTAGPTPETVRQFLMGLIDAEERAKVRGLIFGDAEPG